MSAFSWPTREQVIAVHDASIERFGGASGIRDPGMVLRANGIKFKPRHAEFCNVMLGVAAGDVSLTELIRWVEKQIA